MSFGFAIGDFISCGELAFRLYKDVYKVSRTAPTEVKELAKELSVLSNSIQLLIEEAQDPESVLLRSGERRVAMVKEMMSNTKETLTKLETFAKKHELLVGETPSRPLLRRTWDKLKFSKDASTINSLRARLNYHCGVINLLLTSVGNSSLERLEGESQSISRTTKESLSILQDLMAHVRVTNQRSPELLHTPVISANEAEMFKEELSLEFMQDVETNDACTWPEIGIDTWLIRGRQWWCKGRFEVTRLRMLKRYTGDHDDCSAAYKSALTCLLKASWIITDVVSNHPQRSYVTTAHRQLSISTLASDNTAELRALHQIRGLSDPVASMLDITDFQITREHETPAVRRFLERCCSLNIEKGLLPDFHCLAEVTLGGVPNEPTNFLVRLEQATAEHELLLSLFGIGGHLVVLRVCSLWWTLGLDSALTQVNSSLDWSTCTLHLERDQVSPGIEISVLLPDDIRDDFEMDILLKDPRGELLTILRSFLRDDLRRLCRELAPFEREANKQSSTVQAALKTRKQDLPYDYNIDIKDSILEIPERELSDREILIEVVARFCMLNPIRSRVAFSDGYLRIRQYRWLVRKEADGSENGPDMNNDELSKAVTLYAQDKNWPPVDFGTCIEELLTPRNPRFGWGSSWEDGDVEVRDDP